MTNTNKEKMIDDNSFKERVLENQETLLLALSEIITPMITTNRRLTHINNELIDCYHRTRKMLNKPYIESRINK